MKTKINHKSRTLSYLLLILIALIGFSCAGKTDGGKKKKKPQTPPASQNQNANQQTKKPAPRPITNWNQAYAFMKSKPYKNFGAIRLENNSSGGETIRWQRYRLELRSGQVSYVTKDGMQVNSGLQYSVMNELVSKMELFRRQDASLVQ